MLAWYNWTLLILFSSTKHISCSYFYCFRVRTMPMYLISLDINSMIPEQNLSLAMITRMMKMMPRLMKIMISGRRYSREENNMKMMFDHRNKQLDDS